MSISPLTLLHVFFFCPLSREMLIHSSFFQFLLYYPHAWHGMANTLAHYSYIVGMCMCAAYNVAAIHIAPLFFCPFQRMMGL